MTNNESELNQRILDLSRELRLGSHVLNLVDEGLEFTSTKQFVCDLLEGVKAKRNQEVIRKNLKLAGFDKEHRLETFEFNPDIYFPDRFPKEWFIGCDFVREKQNVMLLGNSGTGKTHLATALGRKACEMGYKVMYRKASLFIDELTTAYEKGQFKRYREKVNKLDLLVLDEWGYLPVSTNSTKLLYDILSDCYENRSIMLTTNLPLKEWNRIFSDERLINALLDRLVHHGLLIAHKGESYRRKNALMR